MKWKWKHKHKPAEHEALVLRTCYSLVIQVYMSRMTKGRKCCLPTRKLRRSNLSRITSTRDKCARGRLSNWFWSNGTRLRGGVCTFWTGTAGAVTSFVFTFRLSSLCLSKWPSSFSHSFCHQSYLLSITWAFLTFERKKETIDRLHCGQNFEKSWNRKIYYRSIEEHPKINKIAKFCCETL